MTGLTHRSFSEFVRTHRFVLIHCWAAWNEYNFKMRAMLVECALLELQNQIAFAGLDVDPPEHWDICRQHNLLNLPFLAFYRDGVLVQTLTGLREREIVVQYMKQLVA